MANYRPVSLLTSFTKVLEKCMHNMSSHYLQTNIILVPEQFGVKKGMPIEDAALKLTESVSKSVNQIMHVCGLFCDLAETFDCVNHEILLTKLHLIGIQGTTFSWFRSCLTENKRFK
jgi:hypothetical protein